MDKEISIPTARNHNNSKSEAIKRKWRNFIDNSTLHGMQYVFNGETKIRSIIWIIFLLGGMIYFIIQSSFLLKKYYCYPINTKQTLEYEESPMFPAVTICNSNRLRRSVVQGIPNEVLNTIFSETIQGFPINRSDINVTKYQDVIHMPELYYRASHQIKDMLKECTWSGHVCDERNFTPILTSMGLCHTFNLGKFIQYFRNILA